MFKKIKNQGFTLIELLVVIAIIGVLASIVLVSLGGARAKANASKAKSDVAQIMTALELYQSDNVNVAKIAVGACGASAAGDTLFDGTVDGVPASNLRQTTDRFAAGIAAGNDLCSNRSLASNANAPVPTTTYLQTIPTAPPTYVYEMAAAPSATTYSIRADGFTDGAGANFFTCINGSCSCTTGNECQR